MLVSGCLVKELMLWCFRVVIMLLVLLIWVGLVVV